MPSSEGLRLKCTKAGSRALWPSRGLEHYKSKLPCRPGLACQSRLPRFSFVCRSKFLPNSEEALKDHVSLKCHKSKLPCQSGLACQSRLPR